MGFGWNLSTTKLEEIGWYSASQSEDLITSTSLWNHGTSCLQCLVHMWTVANATTREEEKEG